MMTDSHNASKKHPQNSQEDKITKTLSGIKHKLMVMSGKGGVGKSSVSAGLAVSLSRLGFKVGLLDVDIHGPSLARIMGVDGLLDVSAEQKVIPKSLENDLKIVSMQALMPNADQAVIWRGPAKTGVIQQFIGDVLWGELDFLIVDAPPGTGDEPLSVAQMVPGAKAVIVTTPQDVALADVRKSINFCRTVNLEILGLVENMGPFACPCCGETIALFKSDGGRGTAEKMNIPFLGTLPFDNAVVKAFDRGEPFKLDASTSDFFKALEQAVNKVVQLVQ